MPSKLPSVPSRRVIRALERAGFAVATSRGKGSHTFMWRASDQRTTNVPNHNPVKKGTLRKIVRDAGLTVEQFVDLL
ncbi:MAG: type II toxin-antitoxin system HicA family toxin [Planctomycetota bacterium]